MSQDQLEQLIKDFYQSLDKWPDKAAAVLRQRGEPGNEISVAACIDIMLDDSTPKMQIKGCSFAFLICTL